MPDEMQQSKEQKLAAARRKLKEYQRRHAEGGQTESSVSSNVSEKSDFDCNTSEHGEVAEPVQAISTPLMQETKISEEEEAVPFMNHVEHHGNDLQTLQLLINEKTQLTQDVNKLTSQLSNKELECEELRSNYNKFMEKHNELQNQSLAQQQITEQLRKQNAELQHKLAQSRAENEDNHNLIESLQQEIAKQQENLSEYTRNLKSTSDKLEMAEIRIQQLSDDTNSGTDNRVESLTQTQLMHEQQIRDLQAMVQQLSEEKEHANVQYQSYVQQLNIEVAKVNERNVELQKENEHLQQREQQLVAHVSGLEKEIQKNLNLQQKLKTEAENEETVIKDETRLKDLNEKISNLELERNVFVSKIETQEARLQTLNEELQQSRLEVETLRERLEAISSTQPEHTKLLAIMESDKVAASRAMSQNQEMKKQLDELELRFVQLTNDKAELRNLVDAEEFANREMRQNYQAMEERMRSIDERFKYKDEEMIRLAHENTHLTNQVALLKEQLRKQNNTKKSLSNGVGNNEHSAEDHDHTHDHEHEHTHDHEHEHNHVDVVDKDQTIDSCVEVTELSSEVNELYTSEAMEKLQERFTKLIGQVADLTDEKQRLEHLVLQLQGETETIGEYITLYQTQRRMLKQREYEKAAQMQLLQEEREQLREKIQILNNLVSSLGMPHANLVEALPANEVSQQQEATTESSSNSQAILDKIHHIITEIEQNTKDPVVDSDGVSHTADHLKCCSGKFEVV